MLAVPRALTIAGSDSGAGAGIQADLKTFFAFGVYGLSALTAVTAQNTRGVQAIVELAPDFVVAQIECVFLDIGADAAKTGMLGSVAVIEAVVAAVTRWQIPNLVVDPVMVATSGETLLRREAQAALRERLLPLATVVTPNLPEAEALTGRPVASIDDMQQAARALHDLGARWVVVKGGHLDESQDAVDVVYDGGEFAALRSPRLPARNTHGTGCTFSAAIAAGLARGLEPFAAIERAKQYITRAIGCSLPLGEGHGPLNHRVGVTSEW